MPFLFEDTDGAPGNSRGSINLQPDQDISLAASIAEPTIAAPTQEESTGEDVRLEFQKLNAAIMEENARIKRQCAELQQQNSALLKANSDLRFEVVDLRGDTTSETSSQITTLVVRIDRRREGTADMLMRDLDLLGFAGQYDYCYVPRTRKGTKGYAFVNMTEAVYAQRFNDCVEMLQDPKLDCLQLACLDKTTAPQEARIQGRDANLRNLWFIFKGMWPAHDCVPFVRVDGTMKQVLPWDYLDEEPPEANNNAPQTLCLRGIPYAVGPVEMMEILDKNGFEGSYSYFFMPCDVRSFNHRGYAFVHLETQELARLFIDRMNDYAFDNRGCKTKKTHLRVCLAMQQGVVSNLEHSKTIKYSGSLLFYPWVRIDGEMKCVSTEDALQECLQDLKSRSKEVAESQISTDASTDASTDESTDAIKGVNCL
jgi:RNA recognition motif-containing protein